MFCRVHTATTNGLQCVAISAEVDIAGSWPGFHIVGLADTAVQEAKHRIRSAWRNSGFSFPSNSCIVINLAPANIRKNGTAFDLPMAVAMMLASEHIDHPIDKAFFVGELGLDATIRPVTGILPVALYAKEMGFRELYVPEKNAAEAAIIEGVDIYPVSTLLQLRDHLTEKQQIQTQQHTIITSQMTMTSSFDMQHIKGQQFVKRALEIAASGGHNILLTGPPGSGKTLLARTLPSILPTLSLQESIDVTRIYSVAGLLAEDVPLIQERPFRAPHHSASGAALVGGGTYPKPGEISLAHRGVLFLDEFPEFSRQVLETLRQPLEDRTITISRAQGSVSFPAGFMLVASQNPCPCGFQSDPQKACICSPHSIERYNKKVSGPLLDRIDVHIEVPRVPIEELAEKAAGESSAIIRERVCNARRIQQERFIDTELVCNSDMKNKEINEYCQLDEESTTLMKQASEQLQLSARSYHRILKLSRTIADLAGSKDIQLAHVAEALQYRKKAG